MYKVLQQTFLSLQPLSFHSCFLSTNILAYKIYRLTAGGLTNAWQFDNCMVKCLVVRENSITDILHHQWLCVVITEATFLTGHTKFNLSLLDYPEKTNAAEPTISALLTSLVDTATAVQLSNLNSVHCRNYAA